MRVTKRRGRPRDIRLAFAFEELFEAASRCVYPSLCSRSLGRAAQTIEKVIARLEPKRFGDGRRRICFHLHTRMLRIEDRELDLAVLTTVSFVK